MALKVKLELESDNDGVDPECDLYNGFDGRW